MDTRRKVILGTAISGVAALVGSVVLVTGADAHTPGNACHQEGARQNNPHCRPDHDDGHPPAKQKNKQNTNGNGRNSGNGSGNNDGGNRKNGNGGGMQSQGHLRCHEGLDGETIAEQAYHGNDDFDGLEGTEADGALVHHPLGNGDLSGPIYTGAGDNAPEEMKPIAYEVACAASLVGG